MTDEAEQRAAGAAKDGHFVAIAYLPVVETLRIREVLPATPRARVVRIALDGRPFVYLPGQAVKIASRGVERRKPYSIASAPEDAAREGYFELLIGVDDAGEAGPHLNLRPDEAVDVEGPIGRFTFPPDPAERRFLFVAGGTGIAPLRAMLRHALNVPHREIGLLYSARTPQEFAFEEELRTLAREGEIDLRQTVTRESAGTWDGTRGRIGQADLAPLLHDRETLCFVCGPPALVADIPKLLGELGVESARVRVEEWT
jgi:ferredoxin-NADP reductase